MSRTIPSGKARCQDCMTELDYDIHSIMWQCRDEDRCHECQAKKDVDAAFEKLKP